MLLTHQSVSAREEPAGAARGGEANAGGSAVCELQGRPQLGARGEAGEVDAEEPRGLADARLGVRSVESRWQSGLIDYGDVLLARASVFQGEDQLAQSDGAIRRDLLSLYKALGGGWEDLPLDTSGKTPDGAAYTAPRR